MASADSGMLVIDISNSFTKISLARRGRLGRVRRIPTPELDAAGLRTFTRDLRVQSVVFGSVVPSASRAVWEAFKIPVHELTHRSRMQVRLAYPKPASIGADRIANAIACLALHATPAIVVDFGTAVTFDVLSADGAYEGGVIAPGLHLMTEYLHERTALLPKIALRQPRRAIGKSTREAMLSGAFNGYRGLIDGIVTAVRAELAPSRRPTLVATGGDAKLLRQVFPDFDFVDPLLTLHGLRLAGEANL